MYALHSVSHVSVPFAINNMDRRYLLHNDILEEVPKPVYAQWESVTKLSDSEGCVAAPGR
jgi:hypothetical protein